MKVGYIQNNPEFGNIKKNVDNIYNKLENINNTLIVLPELFASGYNFTDISEVKALSSQKDKGYIWEALSHISKKNNITIVYGFAEKDIDKFFNSCNIIEKGKLLSTYRKSHLFYKEKLFFSKGDSLLEPVKLSNGVNIGLMICFDWIFPETARTLALNGAHIIAHCTNLVLPFCPDATITRCIENKVFTILSNRIGNENRGNNNHTFIGLSEIVNPNGSIINRSSKDKEDLFVTEINPFEAENKEINNFNNLFEDRRTDLYFE
ncbi:MAG: acyltransferase [Candidatus Muirbacterium halophilum]|nr:acyltransferase [Candidatus Muirbacterium halophilum]MCK9475692.1 acyltransferase [Candidatus Muirbacterium halophilum]